jgi:hypothetical protein
MLDSKMPLMAEEETDGGMARSVTTSAGSSTGSGRKSSPFAMLKMVELAPTASAIERIAVGAKPGCCRRARSAYWMSLSMFGSRIISTNAIFGWIEKTTEDANATLLLAESWCLAVITDFHD